MKNFKPKICKECGEEFTPLNGSQQYCGSRTQKIGCSWKRRHYRDNHRYLDPKFREWHKKYASEWLKKQRRENTEFAQRERARKRAAGKTEHGKMMAAAWRKKNIDKILHANRNRIDMKRGAEGTHSFQEWQECKKKHNFTCVVCGIKEEDLVGKYKDKRWHKLTRDHIVAIKNGGTNYIENIQPLCIGCNARKWAHKQEKGAETCLR